MNSPGLFQISAVLFLSGSAGNILKSAASFFFHPDCTVGSGFQPDQPPMAGRGLIRKGICRHGITAGRELHPTLKNVTFYVIICAACTAVIGYLFIIAENVRVSIPHTSGIIFQFFAVSIPSSICQLPEQILKKPVSLNVINVADQMVLRVKTVMVVILRDRRAHQRVPHETAV